MFNKNIAEPDEVARERNLSGTAGQIPSQRAIFEAVFYLLLLSIRRQRGLRPQPNNKFRNPRLLISILYVSILLQLPQPRINENNPIKTNIGGKYHD